MKKHIIWTIVFVLLMTGVMAAGEIVQTTDKINYFGSETHTITIKNTGSETIDLTATVPSGWTWVSGTGCSESAGTISCNGVTSGSSVSYTLTSPAGDSEYTWTSQGITANNTYTGENVSFLNIRDDEIFHTLVEYGRGRGNYFYDSMGTVSSAGTGTGYPYVPNATNFELNYLHKIFNIKQYFDDANTVATNVSFTCTYPEHTIVRQHLTESISRDGTEWTANYEISEIEGSWERMGFLGEDFDSGEYVVDGNFTVNCTDVQYYLSNQNGWVTVDEDSFTMTVVDINPLSMTATSSVATIGNGTSEVPITYQFTNDERYPLDDVRIQIQAPENADFIGVRGELWGYGEEEYIYDLVDIQPGETVGITLVARFDTSGSTDTSLELTQGVDVEFVPTWELNSYNPLEASQSLTTTQTVSVNYGVSSEITNLNTILNEINGTLTEVNTLVTEINQTTYTIQQYVVDINGTATSIYSVVQDTQTTVNNINSTTTDIYTDTQAIIDDLNCDGTSDSPLCDYALNINNSVTSMQTTVNNINATTKDIYDLNVVMNQTLTNVYTDTQNIYTDTQALIDDLNCDTVSDTPICQYVLDVNNTVTDVETDIANMQTDVTNIQNIVTYLNGTVWNGLTAQDVIDQLNASIQEVNTDATSILEEIEKSQEFNEELVFLVTDAVGMADNAKSSFERGDMDSTVKSLESAEKNLKVVTEQLKQQKDDQEAQIEMAGMSTLEKIIYKLKRLIKL